MDKLANFVAQVVMLGVFMFGIIGMGHFFEEKSYFLTFIFLVVATVGISLYDKLVIADYKKENNLT